jgi:hypothetical protein
MAAGDKVQIGKQFKVEFGGAVWTGYQFASLARSKQANVETITDTRGANVTHVITNPGDQITISAMIEDAAGSITPPKVGDYFAITIPGATRPSAWILLSPATVTHGNGVSTISATLNREDSMAAGYETAISASISPTTATFSLGAPANKTSTITYSVWATSVLEVKNGNTVLTPTTHYTVVGTTLTITSAYLSSVLTDPDDTAALTVVFNAGNNRTFTVTAIA